jgi:hypothetical protein
MAMMKRWSRSDIIRNRRAARWGLVVVLLVAAVLRLAALDDLPLGLHYDEAANLILTRQIVEDGYRPLFIRAYTGKEVLFFYWGAPWVWMTGGAPWGLRLGAAMVGVLTVAATYAAVRALFPHRGRARVALLAAGWLAVAFPHVLLSRYGFRAISLPLLQALTVAALWRGLRTGRRALLIAAGVCLGLTGYTYLAARLFPIPPALVLAGWLVRSERKDRLRRFGRLLTVLVATAVAFAPLGVFFLRHPETFTTRITQVAAPTWREALRGVGLCLRALVWPGGGDPYVRFNRPGQPVMDGLSAVLALVGLAALVLTAAPDDLARAGRGMVVLAIGVMILPSALATGEITPSNLRMVGLFPFLAVLPAWGLDRLLRMAQRRHARRRWAIALAAVALVVGGSRTMVIYVRWASSPALFRTADGEMVLAARALDRLNLRGATAYIASEHYRHPTVGALADRYAEAVWLTGGANLVLPPEGDMVALVPDSLAPPAPWPEAVTARWRTERLRGPGGEVVLLVHRLPASEVQALRARLTGREDGARADFAHVAWVHGARPTLDCRVASPCPILVTWEPRAVYPAVQPVVRLLHRTAGEWARTMAFHYAPEQWTPGDVVLDYLVVTPPVGTPPGDGYRIGVSFFDTAARTSLPLLQDERFAGLEARFPETGGFRLAPMPAERIPAPGVASSACPGVSRDAGWSVEGLRLLGWALSPEDEALPGEVVKLRLCWRATSPAPDLDEVRLVLEGGEASLPLYAGAPAGGFAFAAWREGEIVEDRYDLRLPRTLDAGTYTLALHLDGESLALADLAVQPIARTFTAPAVAQRVDADFGGRVRLLGYDRAPLRPGEPWRITLFWQALDEMAVDYTVFVHLRPVEDGGPATQVDEMPRQGAYPTSLWLPGEVVSDTHTLAVPADLAPASYAIDVGLYVPETGRYLPVAGDVSLTLGTIKAGDD